jgi:uncharacterized membrane protein (GlpM family)
MTQILLKTVVSVAIILCATGLARRYPSMGGLIGVMPLTGALVLVWTYLENKGDRAIMENFAAGSLLGLVPTVLFFLVALIGIRKGFTLPVVLSGGFAAWLIGAIVHQYFLR